jgi:hypothetical protein
MFTLLCGTCLCLTSFGCRRSTEETQSQTASTNGAKSTDGAKKSSQDAKGKPGKKSATPVKVANSKTKTKENGRKTEKASLQDFPKDLPLYPGAKVLGVGTSDMGVVAGLETKDAPQKVMEFYQYKLNAQGWIGKSATTTKQGGILEAEKKPRRCIVTVGFKPKTKMTTFSLTVLNK